MQIWLAGQPEPREFDPREVVELIASRGLLKDTLILDRVSNQWLMAGNHPLTARYFESASPAPDPADEPSEDGKMARWWPTALAWMVCAMIIAGGTWLLLMLGESASWVVRFLALGILSGPIILAGLQFLRKRRPDWEIGQIMFAGAVITSALLVIFLAIHVPVVRKDTTKKSFERALTALHHAVELGTVPKSSFSGMVYGKYAPFLNLLQKMAYDYEKEVADYHGQMASILGAHPIGPGVLGNPEKLTGLRTAFDEAKDLNERHREDILLKLDTYQLGVNALPYSPETCKKVSAAYDRLQNGVAVLVNRNFDGESLTLAAMDQWIAFYVNNPNAYVVSNQGFSPVDSFGPGGIRIVETMMRTNVQYTDPIYANEARIYAEAAKESLAKSVIVQNDLNRYYAKEGRETILEMEQAVREDS